MNIQKIWKIAAGKGGEFYQDFLDNQRITIGFVDMNISQFSDIENLRQKMREVCVSATEGRIINWSSQLWRFYYEMETGQYVMVYNPSTRMYSIGKITSEVRYLENTNEHHHEREVTWETEIFRDQLSTQTRNTLGAILTLYSLHQDAIDEINQVLEGEEATSLEEESTEVDELGENVETRSLEFIKDQCVRLNWEDMQELIAGLLRAMGYKTRVSSPGPDRGKDVIASPDGLGLEEPRIHVEVKHRPGTPMGAPEIRAFTGGLRNTKGMYVSTGGFTQEAKYEADRAQRPLILIDMDELANLVVQYYDQFDSETKTLLPLRKIYWPL